MQYQMQYQMFKNLKNDDVIQAGDEVVGGYINKWTSLEPGANAINYKASFYDKTSFRFRRKVDSAPKFKQHDTVKIGNKDSKFFGVTGRIVGIRFEPLGFVYRIKYDVPQDVEQYKYSWYIESELDNIYYDPRNIKLGQRVKINALKAHFQSFVNEEGVIVRIDQNLKDTNNPLCWVDLDRSKNDLLHAFFESELETITNPISVRKFKVGQKVTITCPDFSCNAEGRIIADDTLYYHVSFDNNNKFPALFYRYIESELKADPNINKFKIGQRVRVNNLAPIFTGKEGEITKVDCKEFDYCVFFGNPSNGGPLCFNENELDLIEETKLNFKVGQRVVISKLIWLPTQGDIRSGVIERVLGNGNRIFDYVVRLDSGMSTPFKENEIELEADPFEKLAKEWDAWQQYVHCAVVSIFGLPPTFLNSKYADLPVSKYRYLKIGEKIQKGDEYNSILCGWIPSLFVGGAVTSYDDKNNVYRRKTA
jgi:hypothetical protein